MRESLRSVSMLKGLPKSNAATSALMRSLSRKSSIAVILIGTLVILGWVFDISLLKSILPGLPLMKVNTAGCFILAGSSLWLWHQLGKRQNLKSRVIQVLIFNFALLLILTASLTLIEHRFNLNLGIDQLLMQQPEPLGSLAAPGRIAANSAGAFWVIGAAFLFITNPRPRVEVVQTLAVILWLISFIGLLGHVYGSVYFYTAESYTGMALHTAIAFQLLSVGLLCALPDGGLMPLITGNSVGSLMFRRLLPMAIALPVLVNGLTSLGYRLNFYGNEIADALSSTLEILIFAGVIGWNARSLNRIDLKRREASERLQQYANEIEDLYNNAPCGYHSLDANGTIVRINNTELNWLGYSREELLNQKKITELFTPASLQIFQANFPRFKHQGYVNNLELKIVRKDSSALWVSLNATAIKDAAGNFIMSRSTLFDISERKQAEAAQREMQVALENAVSGISRLDVQGRYLTVNQAYASAAGYSPAEMIGMEWQQTVHPDDLEKLLAAYEQMLQDGKVEVEARGICKDGSLFYKQLVMVSIYDEHDQFIGHHCFMKDITDRKQTEASLAQLAAIVECSGDAIISKTLDGIILSWNKSAEKIFGYQSEEIIGQSITRLIPSDLVEEEQHILEAVKQGKTANQYETVRLRQDGKRIDIAATVSPLKDSTGRIIGASVTNRDISDRKRAEAALRQSEARFQAFMNHSPATSWITDANGTLLYVSQTYTRTFQLPTSDLIDKSIFELYSTEVAQRFLDNIQTVAQTQQVLEVIEVAPRPDGTVGAFRVYKFPIPDASGQTLVGGVAIDITQQHQAEIALQKSEERLQMALEASGDGLWDWEIGKEGYLSPLYQEMLGYQPGELVIDVPLWEAMIHPDDRAWVMDRLNAYLQDSSIPYAYDYRLRTKTGEWKWIANYGKIVARDAAGTPVRIIGMHKDITERKRVDEALRLSQERLQLALEASGDGLWDWNIVTGEVYYSPQYMTMLGYEADELPQNLATWEYLTHPDDRSWVLDILNAHLQNISPSYSFDYRVRTKSGGWKWVADYGKVVARDDKGQPLRMIGTHRDVHDRKQAEQQLELQAVITRNMAEGICLVRADDGTIVYANPKFEQMFGYDAGELNGQHVSIVNYAPDPEGAEAVNQAIRTAVLQNREATYEVHNVKKDGTGFWSSATTSVFNHSSYGDVLVAVHQDITDRKQAEERIAASLKEKEVLLKEIHHRVKNNLGIVSGLLQIQARRTQDSASRSILQDSQNRIASIALVHEKLYRSENLANIDFSQYLQDLTIYLFDSYNISSNQITLHIQVESASLEIETAIPCGLIVNELVSNALKHAFPGDTTGEIQVRLAPSDTTLGDGQSNRLFTLVVRDNGVGLPNDFDPESTRTLGISLVQGLVAQIRGAIEINGQHGTEVKITFREGGL